MLYEWTLWPLSEVNSGTLTLEGYLYDGWNVVMISNLNPADGAHLARKWSCVWRPDVGSRLYARSSWQEAGGVGGLAWMQTGIAQTVAMYTYQSVTGNAEVHIPMMDHMGNVRHYYQIKATGPGAAAATVTGQVTANLDYDAFGREVRATGPKTPTSGQPPGLVPDDPWVDNLPFHFSTKFTDRESGLNYYGYRFYDPVDGRWLNRDPLEEAGGKHLYAFVENGAVGKVDGLGLAVVSGCQCPCAEIGALTSLAETLEDQIDDLTADMEDAADKMEEAERLKNNAMRRLGFSVAGGVLAAEALRRDLQKYRQQRADYINRMRLKCPSYKPRIPKAPKLITGRGKGGLVGLGLSTLSGYFDNELMKAQQQRMKDEQTRFFQKQQKLAEADQALQKALAEIAKCVGEDGLLLTTIPTQFPSLNP